MLHLAPNARAPQRIRAAAPPTLRYLPLATEAGLDPAVSDVRAIWSPALFSLPSRAGFSGTAARRAPLAPTLEAPNRETAALTPPRAVPAEAAVLMPRQPPTRVVPLLAPPRAFDPLPPLPTTGDRIEALDPELAGALEATPLAVAGTAAAAWEAVVWFVFDETGVPRHALIERLDPPETPPAARVLLQRSLREWRAAPGVERAGRVRIRHAPAPSAGGNGGGL